MTCPSQQACCSASCGCATRNSRVCCDYGLCVAQTRSMGDIIVCACTHYNLASSPGRRHLTSVRMRAVPVCTTPCVITALQLCSPHPGESICCSF